ncbi:hypothetical protein BRADI_2g28143v3, partial [Brachypodium distachyon]
PWIWIGQTSGGLGFTGGGGARRRRRRRRRGTGGGEAGGSGKRASGAARPGEDGDGLGEARGERCACLGRRRGGGRPQNSSELRATAAVHENGDGARQKKRTKNDGGKTAAGGARVSGRNPAAWTHDSVAKDGGKREEAQGFKKTRSGSRIRDGARRSRRWRRRRRAGVTMRSRAVAQ